jgi:hypothetical protein
MKRFVQRIVVIGFCIVSVFTALSLALSAEVPRMSKEELKTMLDKGDVTLLDVRAGKDWTSSEYKIHKAVREDPDQVESWATKYPKDQTLVVYCA